MKVTYSAWIHDFTSMGIIALNVVQELIKLKVDVGLNVLNPTEIDINKYSPEVQEAIKKGHRTDSIGIFFSYPDSYASVRCKVNVGYTGCDSSGGYLSNFGNPWENICNKICDYMLTPSDYSRQIMKNCGVKIPIELFPHGVNPEVFNPIKRNFSYPFTFLYTGELSERKGTLDLIKVFKMLYQNNKNFQLILRANTHMKYYGTREVLDLCKDCENIKLIWKDNGQEEIVDYMNFSHVYCYPSKADWAGMTVFESLATGLPTIATSTNGYFEFLKDYIIDLDYNEEEIGNKHPYLKGTWNSPDLHNLKQLMVLVTNEETYKNLSEFSYDNSKKIIEEFSWENVTKKYLIPFLEEVDKKHFGAERKKFVENKRVTIGIPSKDRGIELAILLQSLQFQTYQDFDVLLVDDWFNRSLLANTTIQALIKILQDSGHNVRVLPGERRGPHIAGQKILENSKHELILRLDDDVSLRPTFIEELVKMFEDDDVVAVGPIYLNPHEPISTQVIDPNLSKEFLEQQGKIFWDDNGHLFLTGWLNVNIHPTEEPLQVEHLNSGFMYRKSVGLEIGGYFLDFSPVGHREESDFSFRLCRTGRKLFINPKAIAFHYHPLSGGIRETDGKMLSKQNWDHDEKLFLDRMEKLLPKPKIQKNDLVSVIILTYGTEHKDLRELLTGISTYTNHNCEYIVFNNDIREESQDSIMKVRDEFKSLNIQVVGTTKELPVSEARNEAVKFTSDESKFICFIDDDARITGRYNQNTDFVDYLYNRFHEEPDTGCVSPIVTWFEDFQTKVASVSCLFTSKKVWEIVGGFDSVFGNKEKQTWGWEDTDWSYRAFLKGFKIVRVKGFEFPFYHPYTDSLEYSEKKGTERNNAILKGRELLLAKYDINKIKEYNRTVYPFTEEQMNVSGLKLNLGAYHMYIDGFTNVDIKTDIAADLICDIRNLNSKFPSNSVDMILCSHNLEHITEEEAKETLKTIKMILKPGGIFIVEVPDCENLEDKVSKGIIDENLRQTCKYGMPGEFGQKHEAEYTRETLRKLLMEVGFTNIVENPNTSLGINFNLRSEAFRYDCRK